MNAAVISVGGFLRVRREADRASTGRSCSLITMATRSPSASRREEAEEAPEYAFRPQEGTPGIRKWTPATGTGTRQARAPAATGHRCPN